MMNLRSAIMALPLLMLRPREFARSLRGGKARQDLTGGS
jgi:hypothetical protein